MVWSDEVMVKILLTVVRSGVVIDRRGCLAVDVIWRAVDAYNLYKRQCFNIDWAKL